MMPRLFPGIFLSGLLLAGCSGPSSTSQGGNPAAPGPLSPAAAPSSIALSAREVTLGRNATSQVTALLSPSGDVQADVTASATWTTSDAAIVSVSGGLIKGIAPGSAVITASYQGLTVSAPITVRRNLAVAGTIRITDPTQPYPGVSGLRVRLDDREVASVGGSDYCAPSMGLSFPGFVKPENANVDPGAHTLSVEFTPTGYLNELCPVQGHVAATDTASHYKVIDRDTKQVLATVTLGGKAVPGGAPPAPVSWVLDIDASGSASVH